MDAAFAWVGAIAEWFGKFFPRWEVIPTTHGGVKWVKGATVVVMNPGIHWYWPVTTVITLYPTARQTVNLRSQTLTLKDGKTVVVGGMLVYDIVDIEAILAHTWDPEETIRDIAAGALHDVICQHTWEELTTRQRSGELDRALRRDAKKDLDKYGVRVLRTTLTDLAPCRVYKLMQSTSAD